MNWMQQQIMAHTQVHAEQSQYKEIVATFAHAQAHTQNEDVKIGMNWEVHTITWGIDNGGDDDDAKHWKNGTSI